MNHLLVMTAHCCTAYAAVFWSLDFFATFVFLRRPVCHQRISILLSN